MADVVCSVLLLFVFCVCRLELVISEDLNTLYPAPEFGRHTLIKPRIYHGREKRQISSSKDEEEETGGHIHHLAIGYNLDGTDYVLDLRLNRDLLPKGYFHKYQQNGTHVVNKPTGKDVELCQYQGTIRGIENSWAAVSTCRKGLSGVIYDGNELMYLEKATNDLGSGVNDVHFLYKHSDLLDTGNKTCGYASGDSDDNHPILESHEYNRILRYKRASKNENIRGPYNANKRSRYVELVLVVDNREYKELGENLNRVYQHSKDIANIINALYAPLNIFIALVGVVVWTEYDEIDLSPNGDATLTNFLHYRREKLIKEHPNDNAQLLTKFVFDKGVVGKALKGPICTFEYSGGVSMDHSNVISLVATTVAHEMGHNFGMEHDNNECECPEERCIMAPSSSSQSPTRWSSCSLEYLALAFEHGMDYCLRNKPDALFDSPVCGNGFVEPGEQCDCGLPDRCDNTCCNATTCMLHSNASCATGECCDLQTCQPKYAGTLCRSADFECDLPEYCTGQSEYCPQDIYKMDTETCDGGKAFCYQGSCRTRSDQCKLLWGTTGKSSDEQCYHMNTKGSRHGNCGYNRFNQSFFKCEDENILCGMLHCRHLNERLEFGMESVAILSHSFINLQGSIIACRTAIVDLGLNQVDPGLAPDGAKCGDGKMCVNQKCMSVDSLRLTGSSCPNDCSGNGACNSMGHCHCKDGFAPPYCDAPGPGGSEDSGPASDPNARKEFVTAMYIVFLGVIPVLALFTFLSYYMRRNLKLSGQKPHSLPKSPSKSRSNNSFQPEPTIRTEDNASLLQQDSASPPNTGLQNAFFGQFKGFTLAPLKDSSDQKSPVRSPPPVPAVPTIPNVLIKSPVTLNRTTSKNAAVKNSFLNRAPSAAAAANKANSVSNAVNAMTDMSIAPALPPLNPGAHPRPLISSPILENSTCTAKELISPLRNAPKIPIRPAPEAPPLPLNEIKRPLSSPNAVMNSTAIVMPEETTVIIKKPKEGGNSTLNRIASFLKSGDKKPASAAAVNASSATNTALPRNNSKTLDKGALRNVEISNPIPQKEIQIAVNTLPVDVGEESRAVVMRAQSMRGNDVTHRPKIQTFGSMRQPNGFKRPTSIPVGNRPKSPPPPRPPLPAGEQNSAGDRQYDDCLNEAPLASINEDISPQSSDNIYAVIEESPPSSGGLSIKSPPGPNKKLEAVKSNSGSSESVGLLGEIVSEIQSRNLDSIYSTSTLARKKKEAQQQHQQQLQKQKEKEAEEESKKQSAADTYVNTSSIYKSPGSVYSNMSSASTTASNGYINPSAVNPPISKIGADKSAPAQSTTTPPRSAMSTFKSDTSKPQVTNPTYKSSYTSPFQRPQGPMAASFNSKIDASSKTPAAAAKPTAASSKVTTPPSPTNKANKPLSRQVTPTSATTAAPAAKQPLSRQVTPPSLSTGTAAKQQPPLNRQVTPPNLTGSGATNPAAKQSLINRQKTPPNIRTRKPSPTRPVPPTPKNQQKSPPNNPDIITSCSTNNANGPKSPDVLNSAAPAAAVGKQPPISKTVSKINAANKVLNKTNSDAAKPPSSVVISAKSGDKTVPPSTKAAPAKLSNVASLQQKFENKPPISSAAKLTAKSK